MDIGGFILLFKRFNLLTNFKLITNLNYKDMSILLFFCILFSILSVRMIILETIDKDFTPKQWYAKYVFFYIPTCILWSIFYYLS